MKKFQVYSYNNLISVFWLASCVLVICYGFSVWIRFENGLLYATSISFATICIYAIPNLIYKSNKTLDLYLIAISGILALIFIYFADLNYTSLVYLFISSLVSLLYVLPNSKSKLDIRSIPTLKILIVAGVWLLTCFFIPILNSNQNKIPIYILISIFLLLLANIIPFEIRDRKYDAKKLKTIPQIVGVSYALRLGLILISLSAVIVLFENCSIMLKILFNLNCIYLSIFFISPQKYRNKKLYFIFLDTSIFLLGIAFLSDFML